MIDIVNGLRRIAEEGYRFAGDAADEIERLRASLEAAETDAAHQKALTDSALRVAEGWERKCDSLRADKATLQQMMYSLKDRLEVAEKERESWKGLAKQFGQEADALQ